jgi:hypothetical protein
MISYTQQPGEGAKAYAAFKHYLDLGVSRSVATVARQRGKSVSLHTRWSARWQWIERARNYDMQADRRRNEQRDKELQQQAVDWASRMNQTRERAWRLSEKLIEKAEAMMAFPLATTTSADKQTIIHPAKWSSSDVARYIEVAQKLSNLCTGLPTEHHEHTGPEGAPLPVPAPSVIFYCPTDGRNE